MKTIIEQEKIEENKELLDLIREDFYRIRPKTQAEFFKEKSDTIPSLSKLKKMFNNATYNEILLTAGVEEKYLNAIRRYKEEYLIQAKRVVEHLGYIPSINELERQGVSVKMLKKHYGNYENIVKILEEEGYERIRIRKVINETDVELLKLYVDFSNRIGKTASVDDINSNENLPNAGVFVQHFGGMNELRKRAGFEEWDRNNKRYTKSKIIDVLLEKIIKKQDFLTAREIDKDNDLASETTILRYFRTSKLSQVNKEILQIIKEKDYELYKKLSKNK